MPKRQHQDSQIEPQRPVVDVIEVVLYPLLETTVPTQIVDLPPTGDACLPQMLLHVARDLLAKTLDEFGPLGTGTDERHLAFQNIDQLRQFVEARASQHPADRRGP